jgi:predicted metal-dependent hydrolase
MNAALSRCDRHLQGLEAYARGDHHEAWVVWESLWRDEPHLEQGRLLQALVQLASAVARAKDPATATGAARLVGLAEERVGALPDVVLGLDIRALERALPALREAMRRALEAATPLGEAEIPPLVQVGELGPWLEVVATPAVPAAARSAWFEGGLAAYARGDFFDAHELWEQLWRDERDEDPKQLLQGIIQVAAAMHKARDEEKPGPAANLLRRATLRLSVLPQDYFGLELGGLVRAAQQTEAALATLASSPTGARRLDAALIPPIERVRSPSS